MKKLIYSLLLLMAFAACNKEKPLKTEFCDSPTCTQYFQIWKELFMERNNMTSEYFDAHIFPYKTSIDIWDDGESFRVAYQVKIDWMVCHSGDRFVIKIESETYPYLYVPRHVYLNKTEINAALDSYAFGSDMNTVQSIDHLYFESPKKAVQFARKQAGNRSVNFSEYAYQRANPVFTVNGHPYMHCWGTVNKKQNQCVQIILDLFTGTYKVNESSCSDE